MALRVGPLEPRHDRHLAAQVLSLQLRSYAVEAELIGDSRIPALRETVEDVLESTLSWLAVRDDDASLVAAIGYAATARTVDIDRLVVDPEHLRRGAGRLLVEAVQELAVDRPVTVATGRANGPARALYERLGFARTGDEEVLPGLWVTHYSWAGEA